MKRLGLVSKVILSGAAVGTYGYAASGFENLKGAFELAVHGGFGGLAITIIGFLDERYLGNKPKGPSPD